MSSKAVAVVMLLTLFSCGRGGRPAGDGAAAADGAMNGDRGDVGPATESSPDRGSAMDALTRPDSLSVDGMVLEQGQCHTLPNTAPVIAANVLGPSAVPPELHGGTIVDGRYEVVAVDQYPGGNAGAQQPLWQRTVEFQASATRWLVVNLNYVSPDWIDYRPSLTLTVDPTGGISATFDACSGQSSTVNQYRYEATADEVTMWYPLMAQVLHYLRSS